MRTSLSSLTASGLMALAALFAGVGEAHAQFGHSHGIPSGYGRGGLQGGLGGYGRSGLQGQFNYGNRGIGVYRPRSGLIYHPPSVHYDRVYHADRLHWTSRRGWHTHGHYHVVPHYVPGHFDRYHRGHIHPNPYYHH